jgi:acetylornithine deacetylase/succinyl-diaminopimelate desuccinylase-like protein
VLNEQQRQKVLRHITKDAVAQLTKELVDIPTPTGKEREIGEYVLDWYASRNKTDSPGDRSFPNQCGDEILRED